MNLIILFLYPLDKTHSGEYNGGSKSSWVRFSNPNLEEGIVKIVTDQTPFSIAPADIDTERHFYGAFGRREREISARYIVGLYQQNGGWKPFTAGEIEAFYKGCGLRDGFWFNGLDHDGFVVLGEDGMYRVTEEFITRCFTSSPAK